MDSLTEILLNFTKYFYNSITNLTPYAQHLVLVLAIIDTVLSHLKQLEDGNHLHILTWNVMKYGFTYWAIEHYREYFLVPILKGFITVGLKAGGDNGISLAEFIDPSNIIKMGADLGVPLGGLLQNIGIMGGNMGQQMSIASTQLGIELSFIIIAVQVFLVILEYYIIGGLAIILLPFGACVHTRFLAEKVWPAIVACGVKLMVLAFILSVAVPTLRDKRDLLEAQLHQNPFPELTSATSLESLGTSMALAFLCWQAPSMAAALLSGTSSASAGEAVRGGQGMQSAGTAVGGMRGGESIGKAMEGVKGALGKAASSLGTKR